MRDSSFLNNLIGRSVKIVCKDAVGDGATPLVILREISVLGVVGENPGGLHFFPWTEVAEISPHSVDVKAEDLSLAFCADSEP